jgi:hypothetical protein
MRTAVAVLAAVFMTFMTISCAGPKPAGTPPAQAATGPDELDAAIREASTYFNGNIEEGTKIAILAIKSDFPKLSEYVIDVFTGNVVNDRKFKVVERSALDAIRQEMEFQMSGEVDDNSAQAIGRKVGAQTIIIGSVSDYGNMWRLSIRALAVESAEVVGLFNKNIANGGTVAALTSGPKQPAAAGGGTRAAAGAGGQGGQTTPTLATTAQSKALANGKYTFFPRLSATKAGLPVDNIFIAQITVAGGYMTVHFARTAKGAWTPETEWDYGPSGFYDKQNFTLQDLDNPSRSYNPISAQETRNGMGRIWSISFNQTNIKRFSLTCKKYSDDNPPYIFDEIIMPDQPDQ